MFRNSLRALVAVCLLFIGIVQCVAADSVKLAYIVGLSGPYALPGEERVKTFQLAADLVNSRGGVLGGKKLEIVPFDNKGNPQEALIVLKQAIDQDIRFVSASVSNIAHAVSDAVLKYNQRNPEKPVVFLDLSGLDPALTEANCNFWHFRFEAHSDMQVQVLVDHIAKQPNVHKVYLINQDYAYGQAVSRAARDMLAARRPDIQIVADEFVPLGKVRDFSPYVSKIRASGADSVLTGNWGTDLSLLIKASNESGLTATFYTVLSTIPGTPSAIGNTGANRIKTAAPWNINAVDAAWEKILLAGKTKYGSLSNLDYLPSFRLIDMLAATINKVGALDTLKIAYALEGMHYAGPSGDSWMRTEDHQMMVPIYLLSFVKAGQAGVKHDEEGTGHGWKTDALLSAKETAPPMKCKMERPQR
jgi:branched-chain amino acid transport system substrate-binding protein